MSMQLGLELLGAGGVADAEANMAGVFEPNQHGVSVERIEAGPNAYAEIVIAHRFGQWFFGVTVKTADEYASFLPQAKHTAYPYRHEAVDEAVSRIVLAVYRRIGPVGGEHDTESAKAARRLLKMMHARFDAWGPSVEELEKIQEARMREDGTWTWDQSDDCDDECKPDGCADCKRIHAYLDKKAGQTEKGCVMNSEYIQPVSWQ